MVIAKNGWGGYDDYIQLIKNVKMPYDVSRIVTSQAKPKSSVTLQHCSIPSINCLPIRVNGGSRAAMTQRVNSGCMAPLTCWVNGGQFNALICQISDATGHTLICQLLCCSESPGKQPEYGCYNSTQ